MSVSMSMPLVGILAVALAAGACEQTSPVEQAGVEPQFASLGPTLVECPIDVTTTVVKKLDARGGTVEVKGHRLVVGDLAVISPTKFAASDQASNYVELNVRADDQESFGFREPVSITIDYSRCTRNNIEKGPLSVWKIDPATKALLKHMGGTDDKGARQITFSTDSLSSYSIAN